MPLTLGDDEMRCFAKAIWHSETQGDPGSSVPIRHGSALLRAALSCAFLFLGASCAPSYREASAEAAGLYYGGEYGGSREKWEALKSRNVEWQCLIDLELGMVAVAEGDHEASSRHLESASEELQVIDSTADDLERAGRAEIEGELAAFVLLGRGPVWEEIAVSELSEEERRHYQDVVLGAPS
ncbi:MAG: hypothetical protein ACUVYA_04300 [Planctomycetota bacterium]